MLLDHRMARMEDGHEFFQTFFASQLDRADLREHVAFEWRTLTGHPASLTMIVEDSDRTEESKIVGIGQLLFVRDSFVHWAKTEMPPHAVYHAARTLPDGTAPLLTEKEIREANSGPGLNGFISRWTWEQTRATADEQQTIREFMYQSFLIYARQYRYKEVLIAAIGDIPYQRCLKAGYRLLNDHADYYRERPLPAGEAPGYILGITREQALMDEVTLACLAFGYSPPRFYFGPQVQEQLRLAVEQGMTDEQISQSLNDRLDTVKKRWLRLYIEVEDIMPQLWAPMTGGQRGREKRRALIGYLRDHPEELRPIVQRRKPQRQR